MKQIKQSTTIEIKRSQINLNPYNPKRHSDKAVKEQERNLKRVGFLGGITWNKASGNLIDGHRRIKAMDSIYKYDGTPSTDYVVKVEAVDMDEKQEKEQLTYMALGNTKADYELVARYVTDIDTSYAGISEQDLSQILSFIPTTSTLPQVESYDDLIADTEDKGLHQTGTLADIIESTPEEKKAKVKEAKARALETAAERYADINAYITVSFANAEEKRTFCELMDIDEAEMFVKGRDLLNMFE